MLAAALPYFNRMHEMTADHVHEEIQLLAIDVSTMLFETQALMPSWRDFFKSEDQTPSYEYLRTILKVLQWLRGGERWVLKSPQHLEQFGPLVSTFPDATFVVTHRDPSPVTVSMATMVAYTSRMSVEHVDPLAIGRYWSARIEDLFRACVEDREVLPAGRSIDLGFHDFMEDDMAAIERIYDVADQPFDDRSRAAMEAFGASHPRGRNGTVVYQPDVLGIDPAERREALAFYRDALRRRGRGSGPGMSTVIRAARADDVGAVLALWRHADAEPSHTDDEESLGRLIAHDEGALMVAESDRQIVGTVIAGWDGWRGSIYRLVVAPSRRRAGLGRRLVRAAEDRLSTGGASRLQAIVVETDAQATGFWTASGWEQQAERLRFVKG